MNLHRLFGNPLFGNHSPLVLRWSDDQLWPFAERLAPNMPAGTTLEMMLAAAAAARSVVTEEKVSGKAVHYSRRRESYSNPDRYRDGDPRNTYYYVTGAMDILREAGLITHKTGNWGLHRESIAIATGELVALIGDLCDISEARELTAQIETIVVRGANKRPIDYEDTPETIAMRAEMKFINEALAGLVVLQFGKRMAIPLCRRIFNKDFDRGGRLYCLGSSHQNMRGWCRRDLQIAVDGGPRPVVELDWSELHIRMAYEAAGAKAPAGDLYVIDGYERGAVKLATNVAFNAKNRIKTIGAVAKDLHDEEALREISGLRRGRHTLDFQSFTAGLITAVENKHHRIRGAFNSDAGARFQRKDSDMAVEVMTEMIERTGRCPLPVHDSFIVADVDAGELRRVMKKVARRRGLPLKLKEKRQTHTTIEDLYAQGSPLVPARPDSPAPLPPLPSTPPLQSHPPLLPLHMWVTQFDQGLQEEGFRPERALETRSEPCPVREQTAEGRGPPSREGKPRKRRTQS